jgi:glycine/D-amino acid oxidase-like deaminating enzyme
MVSTEELTDIDANVQLREGELAAFEVEAGYVEAVQAVASFADAARDAGADIRQGVEVKTILTEKGRVVGVDTNEGRYECRSLVLATGPWAAQLADTVGLKLPVQACRTQVALMRRPPDSTRRGVVYGDFVQGLYLSRPTATWCTPAAWQERKSTTRSIPTTTTRPPTANGCHRFAKS